MSIKNALIIGLGILITVRTTGGILRLVTAGKEVDMAQTELSEAQKENERLKQRLSEVNSPEFVLKEAKEKLGLGVAGDVIVLQEQDVNLNPQISMTREEEPNWRKWWKLYIRI